LYIKAFLHSCECVLQQEYDSNHNSAAQERAKELASSYSYVRPNGQRDFTIFAENGINDASVGENYIAGVFTPDAAVDQWMNIDFARERMLNADVTTMSVGHYEGGVYNNYWVLIFSCPENSYTSNYRQEVLNLVNAERAKYGLQPLVMGDAKLTAAAPAARRRDRNRQFSRSSQWYQVVHCSQRVRRDGCRCWRECRMGQRFS